MFYFFRKPATRKKIESKMANQCKLILIFLVALLSGFSVVNLSYKLIPNHDAVPSSIAKDSLDRFFKLDDMCFITANIGKTQDDLDTVPSVEEFSSRYGSKFFYFSNLEMDNDNDHDDGWNKIVFSDQEMEQYNRWTTHAKWPKFMGWKHPTIRSAACKLIVWCDAYICNPDVDQADNWLKRGRTVLRSKGGLMLLKQPGIGQRGPEYEVESTVKSGKLDRYLGKKTIDWLRSQPDYKIAKQPTVYKTAIMIYNPNNNKIKRVMERFWSVYSQEILGWRDQPFFSYFLSSEKLTPLILKEEDVFRPVDLKFRGFGDHKYTICDIAKNDTKMLQTAKTFDVPWSKWMENNVLNQKNDQKMQTLLADKLLVKEWLEAKRPNLLSKMKIPKTYWNTTDVDTITLKNLPSSYVLVRRLMTKPVLQHQKFVPFELNLISLL